MSYQALKILMLIHAPYEIIQIGNILVTYSTIKWGRGPW